MSDLGKLNKLQQTPTWAQIFNLPENPVFADWPPVTGQNVSLFCFGVL